MLRISSECIPTSVTIGQNTPLSLRNPYYGSFFQDTWRVTQNFTLNLGLRYEFEDGITVTDDEIDSGYRLLQPGVREAEAILVKEQNAEKFGKKPKRRRARRRLGQLAT